MRLYRKTFQIHLLFVILFVLKERIDEQTHLSFKPLMQNDIFTYISKPIALYGHTVNLNQSLNA